ncbi:MAG: glycosyltransferase [Acidimicrobiales bacterium]|nr:glycosyltransferase [Acidimicrobiales bacterium]
MRILLVTEYLPASDRAEITGGVEAYAHYVGGHLRTRHEIEVLSRPTDGSVWDEASLASIPGRLLFLLRALLRGLRAPGDVVIGTTYVVHPIAWLVAKLRRRPVVFWYPDVLLGSWRNGQFGKVAGMVGEIAERIVLRLPVDHYIAISQSTADKLAAHGVDSAKVSVVPCGFEPSVVGAVVPEPGAAHPRIVVVGRLVPYKRVDVVVRALARLATDRPDLRLLVIGQGPERDRLQALATELGVADRTELRGFVARHSDVLGAVAASSAFVSASEIEGFGIVVVEAMALGVPYVVSDIPAYREVTAGGVGGSLFPPGDDEALAAHLRALLDDRSPSGLLAESGREHAERYEWGSVADATADVLADVVDRHRHRSRWWRRAGSVR